MLLFDRMADETRSSYESDISVGCPSPEPEEYFRPLKRLKMVKIDKTSFSISERSKSSINKRLHRQNMEDDRPGVKSFSISDILSHKPPGKIVRPWCEDIPPPAHRPLPQPLFLSQFPPMMFLHRPRSDEISSVYESCSSSGRSSTGGSECCTSPDVLNCSVERQMRSQSTNGKPANSSPLDALFQMTSKTFDELNGDQNSENGSHLNLFNNRQQPKKKRKSRTAFTNNQIFELERRFIYQKYLSPADRDEIAAQLGLSNAQVITWFQNRRAKLKRDMEELKKDVESSKVLTKHTEFLENVQNLGILKKKPMSHAEYKATDEK